MAPGRRGGAVISTGPRATPVPVRTPPGETRKGRWRGAPPAPRAGWRVSPAVPATAAFAADPPPPPPPPPFTPESKFAPASPPPIANTATDDTPGGHVHIAAPGTVNWVTYDRVPVCWNCRLTGARAVPGSPDSSYTAPRAGDCSVTGGGTAPSCDRARWVNP